MAIALSNLSASPFTVLGVSPRGTHDAIVSAAEDRIFDGVDADILDNARTSLTIPRERINAELRFYPDVSPARLEEIWQTLKAGASRDKIEELLNGLPALARLNLATDLLCSEGIDYLPEFCKALAKFEPDLALQAIEDTRSVSKFRKVGPDEWRDALQSYQQDLAEDLVRSLIRTNEPASRLIDLLSQKSWLEAEWYTSTLNIAVDRYDRWSEPKLSKIQASLEGNIELALQGQLEKAISAIENDLKDWDSVNQPVQMRDEARGLDEPKSRKIFNQVRDLALKLANEEGHYPEAKRLSEALARTFPELPSVLARLDEDLETLDELIAQSKAQEILQPLLSAAEAAKADLTTTAKWIDAGHFCRNGKGIAGELFSTHFRAIAHVENSDLGEFRDLPWRITRSVALELSNDAGKPSAARSILEVIRTDAPSSIAAQIDRDLSTLEGLILQGELSSAINAENWDKALAAVSRLIEIDPTNRGDWLKVESGIKSRIASRTRGRWFWGVVALGIPIFALSDCAENGSTTGGSYESYEYEDARGDSPTYETPTTPQDLEADSSADSTEEEPESLSSLLVKVPAAEAAYSTLSRPELRYCMFEERKLSYLEPRVRPFAYSNYNLRIDELNSRCENRRFNRRDETAVRLEADKYRAELEAEAQRILDSWSAQNSSSSAMNYEFGRDEYSRPSTPETAYPAPQTSDELDTDDVLDGDPLAPFEQSEPNAYEY
ncbi:hypothetical protein [Sphingomicrobium lutaoense]|uniref:Uncharacterized protein n=1 Tax=Sphingomicrobium lutaoense TaxID=515949 RepID=A0A839Z1H5_9SPHN|nr:hypothetical protein [Sphingomicrobium lutaoense]MBB3763435.1 hypothetical protein [Sphingomicrobium lutaoense]